MRQSPGRDERISEIGREINRDIVAKKTFTDSHYLERLSDSLNCFSPLQTLISTDLPWLPPCLFCVSGIHRKRNYGFMKSTQPITLHERMATCKSQLEAIIKKPGNTPGVGTSFWLLIYRRTIPGFSFVCNTGYMSSDHRKQLVKENFCRKISCPIWTQIKENGNSVKRNTIQYIHVHKLACTKWHESFLSLQRNALRNGEAVFELN